MDNSTKYDIPWELISASLAGTLSAEEDVQLQQWLSGNPDHKLIYAQIQDIWENNLEDYELYRKANAQEAWNSLRIKLAGNTNAEQTLINGDNKRRSLVIRRFTAIAAIFAGVIGLGVWFMLTMNDPKVYETAANVEKKVMLADGSSVTLHPNTRIEVGHDYNKTSRTIVMTAGEAFFDVQHHTDKPFVVELGITQVQDIGTSFTIQKGAKEINIAVTSGKVSFIKRITREAKELSAGTRITYDIQKESFGKVNVIPLPAEVRERLLNFDNTSLLEVANAIQKVYGKKVIISDPIVANRRFTAHLGNMSVKNAMEVICKSLGLEYADNDSVLVLKEKK